MVTDAESHADEDRKRLRELAEARNNGENAAYQAESQLKDLGEQVDDASKTEIEAAIKDVREALKSEDAEPTSTPRPRRCRPRSTRSPRRCTSAPRSSRPRGQGNGAAADGDGARRPTPDEEDVVDAEVVDEGK